MPHKTTAFFNRNYLDYGAQDATHFTAIAFRVFYAFSFLKSG